MKIFSGVRSVSTSPNFLVSSDNGDTFSYYGRITETPANGYVRGYYKYWATAPIASTSSAPKPTRETSTTASGTPTTRVESYTAPTARSLTTTLATRPPRALPSSQRSWDRNDDQRVRLEHAWQHDVVRYDDGTLAVLWQARVTGTGSDDPDKRMLYARYDGTSWKLTYLVKAGKKLYPDEEDYTGLSALHPDNPNIIYVSVTTDPRDDKTALSKHEIFQGVTCDNGATWKWAPLTMGSTMDNLRPVVPKWDANHTALLWMRGTYRTAQDIQMSIVGTLSGP